jgi:hypothetical protein
MFNHFEVMPFLVGLLVGIVGILFWKEKPRVIVKYPHPSNVAHVTYRDPNGICYKYTSNEVDCDKNEETLATYPLQEGGLPGMA